MKKENKPIFLDKESLIEAINNELYFTDSTKAAFRSIVYTQAPVDAEPVVRCKDCIGTLPNGKAAAGMPTTICGTKPMDFFCAYGKRRTEE